MNFKIWKCTKHLIIQSLVSMACLLIGLKLLNPLLADSAHRHWRFNYSLVMLTEGKVQYQLRNKIKALWFIL